MIYWWRGREFLAALHLKKTRNSTPTIEEGNAKRGGRGAGNAALGGGDGAGGEAAAEGEGCVVKG